MTLMLDNPDEGPATVDGAIAWKEQFQLVNVTVVADPNFSMVVGNSVGTPQITIVNPRDMSVVNLPGTLNDAQVLAAQNAEL